MLKIENAEVLGWEHAIRGMRNPKNSWAKSDSGHCHKDLVRDCVTCVHIIAVMQRVTLAVLMLDKMISTS